MAWVIILLVLAGLVALIKYYSQPSIFAQGIARTQLNMLSSLKRSNPELVQEELYIEALARRPGYTLEDVKKLIEQAKKTDKGISFRGVVWQLVHHEYIKRMGNLPLGSSPQARYKEAEKITVMMQVVEEIIPKEL